MFKKNKTTSLIKAVRAANRLEQIKMFGKTLCYLKIERNKKAYNRKIKHKNKIQID